MTSPAARIRAYRDSLSATMAATDWSQLEVLAEALRDAWQTGRQVFLCGNGGSAANATHLANDLIYGIGEGVVPGLRAHSLPANTAIVTCLGNDRGYEQIFALQLRTLARPGDILIVLSGSGNSPNILAVLNEGKSLGAQSFAFLGFSGGKAKDLADHVVHFAIDDMQVCEDLQLIAGHMAIQWLAQNRIA